MTDNKQTASTQQLSPQFVESFDDFCVGLINLQKMRAVIAELLETEPCLAEAILVTFDTAFREGLIKSSTYDALTTDVDRATSEDEPTEWSEDTRKQIDGSTDDSTRDEPHQEQQEYPDEFTADDTGYPVEQPEAAINTAQSAATALTPGTILKSRFELISQIGAGSMADIYEAIDRRKQEAGSANPRLAIKVISKAFSTHPNALKTLQREVLNSQGLMHKNIIRVFDFDWDDDRFFMTMELLDGRSLVDILDEHRFQPLPFSQARSIIEGTCQGLSYAHEQGIIHADIKPGNIFVSAAGQTKILDFGIARITSEDSNSPVIGAHTPAYASCEVLEGAEPTQQDDIFSLACVSYRMLAGSRAFGSLTALDAERKHFKPQRITTLNPQQWRVLEQSLAFRRADRTADLDAFTAVFTDPTEETQGAEPPQYKSDNSTDDSASFGLPLRFGIPAIAALLIVITVALFWPGPERTLLPINQTKTSEPDTAILPAADVPPLITEIDPPSVVALEATQESPAVVTAKPAVVTEKIQPVVTPPKPKPDPRQLRIDELVKLADDAMNEGRLLDPTDDNARLYVLELAALEPEAPEVQQHRTRLAELMLFEAMIAITDEDFNAATHWISETNALGAPEEMTQRTEVELQKARNAKSARETESIGAIFASATPAAILADPGSPFGTMPAESEFSSDEPVTSPGSLSLAMALPGALPMLAEATVTEDQTGELAEVVNLDVPLSELEFTRFVEPKLPRHLASRRQLKGWVELRFRVNINGRTDDITTLDSEPDDRFNKSAITAVSKWRFKPVYVDGVATEKYSTVRMRFESE